MNIKTSRIGGIAPARLAPWLLVASGLAVLVVFILLARYAHPSSDDFCMAAGVRAEGLLVHLWNHYFDWSGRYSGNALYAAYPLIFGLFDGYRYIPAIVLSALWLATAYFLSTLFATRLFSRPVLLASLCFVAVYVLGMLSPASSLYWMAGAFTYQTSNVLLLVAFALMIRLAERQRRDERIGLVLAVLVLVVGLGIGANETGMLAFTAAALLAVLWHLRSGWRMLWPWLLVLAVLLLCFALVYFSPGNEIRAADFPLRHDFSRSLKGSLSVGSKILWIWVSSPVFIVATLLVPAVVAKVQSSTGRHFAASNTWIVVLLSGTVAMPIALQFPAWWSMGGWPPARTVDAIYFLFLLSWFLTIAAIAARFYSAEGSRYRLPWNSRYASIATLLLAVAFTLGVVGDQNFQLAKTDLLERGQPYSEYLNERYQLIARAVAEGRLYLSVPDFDREYPQSIYFNDIMHDPDHWRNACYADYFQLAKIRRSK